jgi:chemotaxis protein MotB
VSRRHRHKAHVNHERWLVSYADFITLLFAVFVVMYSASKVDHAKMGKMAHAIQAGFTDLGVFQDSTGSKPMDGKNMTPSTGSADQQPSASKTGDELDTSELRKELGRSLASEIEKKQVKLWEGADGLVLSLREGGFYEQGSDVLKETSHDTLDKMAAVLQPKHFRIRIEGHTDNIPIHNTRFASNWELSAARATGMVRIFLERYSFTPERLAAAGYAEFHPVDSSDTPEGRALNRRVDIVVLGSAKSASRQTAKRMMKEPQVLGELNGPNGEPSHDTKAPDQVGR